jgi:hypothetical protein
MANKLIQDHHRHHAPPVGYRWAIGAKTSERLVGAAITGRPTARLSDQYQLVEVTRLVSDGSKNVCSFLYAASARIAREMGFDRIQTFILGSESGVSLRAAGWKFVRMSKGGDWNRPSRGGRRTDQPQEPKQLWEKVLR